ncbi:hypothetical protein ABK040_010260 [Willaertia magna]
MLKKGVIRSSGFIGNLKKCNNFGLMINSKLNHNSIATFVTKKDNIFEIESEKDYEKLVKQSTKPILLDVYADWCGPCRMLSPILESTIEDFKGKVQLVTVNADNFENIVHELGVNALPTVFYIKPGGQIAHKNVGFTDKATVYSLIKKHFGVDTSAI